MVRTVMDVCKLHALGNDFLVLHVDVPRLESADYSPLASAICDRHYGGGADGLIVLADLDAAPAPRFAFRIFNADGSEAEISGNGLRCAATYLAHFCGVPPEIMQFDTRCGKKVATFLGRQELTYFFETDMGSPICDSARVPMILPDPVDQVVGYPLSVGNNLIPVTVLSMGNPHCVVFLGRWGELDQDYLGFNISNHPVFPNRSNVEFVHVLSRDQIRVSFWERGVGVTLSSGSGSCAAAVASILNGFVDEKVCVRTSSGKASVHWRNREEVLLTGPAEVLWRGELFLPESAACELY